jgi:hypothetical protein
MNLAALLCEEALITIFPSLDSVPARLSAMMEKAQHHVSTMTIAKLYRRRQDAFR